MKSALMLGFVCFIACSWMPLCAESTASRPLAFKAEAKAAGMAVKNLEWSIGRARFRLEDGEAVGLQVEAKPVGLYFQGKGVLEYTSDDPAELSILRTNLGSLGGRFSFTKHEGNQVRVEFKRLALFGLNAQLPALDERAPLDLSDGFNKLSARHNHTGGLTRGHAMLLAGRSGDAQPAVWAEMDGGDGPWTYQYDPAYDRMERLCSFRANAEGIWPSDQVVISELPLGWSWKDGQPLPYTLTHARVNLETDDHRNVRVTVEEELAVREAGQASLRFHLLSFEADRGVARKWNVMSITDEQGRQLSHHHDHHQLLVCFPEPLPVGKKVRVRFELAGDVLVAPAGASYWKLGTGAWFPQPSLGGQYFTYECRMRVKKTYVPFSCGNIVSRREEGDYAVLETRSDKPIQFPVVIAGKYNLFEDSQDGLTIRLATYALQGGNEEKLLKLTREFIRYYQPFLGPFPFKDYTIIQIPSWGFGQAPANLMFLTHEAFDKSSSLYKQIFSPGINARIAHEIAHAYWGHVVKMPSYEEQWLTESFSEYCSALAIRFARGEAYYKAMVAGWKFRAGGEAQKSCIPFAHRAATGDWIADSRLRTSLVYDKGAYLLYCLHREIGEKAFATFLKSYQASFRWKFGSSADVIGLLQAITQKDYSGQINPILWGTAMPEPPKE